MRTDTESAGMCSIRMEIKPGERGSHLVKVHQAVRNRQGELLVDSVVYHSYQIADVRRTRRQQERENINVSVKKA